MIKIRLQRHGARHAPFYRMVVTPATTRRDGKFIEVLGTYNPQAHSRTEELKLKMERIDHWLGVGAQPTDTAKSLIRQGRLTPEEWLQKSEREASKRLARAQKGKSAPEAKSEEVDAPKEEAKKEKAPAAEPEAKAEEKAPEAEAKSEEADAPKEEAKKEEAPAAEPEAKAEEKAPKAEAKSEEVDAPKEEAKKEEAPAAEPEAKAEEKAPEAEAKSEEEKKEG